MLGPSPSSYSIFLKLTDFYNFVLIMNEEILSVQYLQWTLTFQTKDKRQKRDIHSSVQTLSYFEYWGIVVSNTCSLSREQW